MSDCMPSQPSKLASRGAGRSLCLARFWYEGWRRAYENTPPQSEEGDALWVRRVAPALQRMQREEWKLS